MSLTSALLRGPQSVALEVDFAVPVVTDTGRASCELPAAAAGTLRAVLDLPGTQEVRVEPGTIVSRTTKDGRTRVEAALEPGRPAKVSWASRDAVTEAPREARWLSAVRSLVTLAEADLRLSLLVEVAVMRGDPDRFEIALPTGYALTAVSGSTLESAEEKPGRLAIVVREPSRRRHQFALALERTVEGGLTRAPIPFPTVVGSSRETGELAIEGVGTLEVVAKEEGTARRMDVSEISPALRTLSRQPLLAAFRYHRRANEAPGLTVDVKRFPDAPVLAAIAERMEATTLLTEQGRRLTELKLTIRNHAQPFVKVDLPKDATVLTAEVEGSAVKPVVGADGLRVPLLRPGFRPSGPYTVSFVYLESGPPLVKAGEGVATLPRLAIPVSLVAWELFAPARCQLRDFGGNAHPLRAEDGAAWTMAVSSGEIGGFILDPSGAVVPGAQVQVAEKRTGRTRSTLSDASGRFRLPGLALGGYRLTATLQGFRTANVDVHLGSSRGSRVDVRLEVGSLAETIEVSREVSQQVLREQKKDEQQQMLDSVSASNAVNIQRKVAGVLPVAVDVPREGRSLRFSRALVLEDETRLTFRYKMKK